MEEMSVGPATEAEADFFGSLARNVKESRESNPYLMHLQHSPMMQALANAWRRRWDRAYRVLNDD